MEDGGWHLGGEDRGWRMEDGKDTSGCVSAEVIGFDNHIVNHAADGLPGQIKFLFCLNASLLISPQLAKISNNCHAI